jgi:hypothetical protein
MGLEDARKERPAMQPDEIEEMLYQRAIRSKVRAPQPERAMNLGYNRTVAGSVVAGAALICTLVLTGTGISSPTADRGSESPMHPQMTDTNLRNSQPIQQNTDPVTASVAMSRIAE